MGQEDYLKSQFDKLGNVLAKMLAVALKLKYEEPTVGSFEALEKTFISELDLDPGFFFALDENNFIQELKQRSFSNEHIKSLADILYYMALSLPTTLSDPFKRASARNAAIILYEHLYKHEGSIAFFDIPAKIRELKS